MLSHETLQKALAETEGATAEGATA
jgi:hypothetical protein